MLTLNPKYTAIIQKILSTHIPDKTVWAYGSRVKNLNHASSDLDLVIIDTIDNIKVEQILTLKDAISESNLPILVDILKWSELPNDFKLQIKSEHEILALGAYPPDI